jgi:hypothetical protein
MPETLEGITPAMSSSTTDIEHPALPESLALLLPPTLLALATAVLLLGSLLGWNPLWPTNDYNTAECVALKDRAGVLAALRQGHDINGQYSVRRDLVRDRPVVLTPLEAAVTTREAWMVRFVIDHGAAVTSQNRARLACFARMAATRDIEAMFTGGEPLDCWDVQTPW